MAVRVAVGRKGCAAVVVDTKDSPPGRNRHDSGMLKEDGCWTENSPSRFPEPVQDMTATHEVGVIMQLRD